MAAKKPLRRRRRPRRPSPRKLILLRKPAPAKKPAAVKAKPAARAAAQACAKARRRQGCAEAPKAPKPAAKAPTETVKPPAPAKPAARASHDSSQAHDASQTRDTPLNINDLDAAAGNDGDEGDSPEVSSTNLLAGPRNVKPYIPRRGEQYMNKEQLEHFRNILNTWKRDLMQEVDRTVLHMKDEAANFPDPNDRATQESEFSLELRTRDRERKLIRKIDEAIKRIEDGSYGYCIETGEEIGIKRLEARPVATLCVEAQERRERREKQYGDRDDRYR